MEYEIIDDKGVIDSGSEEEMIEQFQKYITGEEEVPEWTGDLKLVKVIERYK